MSPYNYCANNPVKFVDPDGRLFTDYVNKKTGETKHVDDGVDQIIAVSDHEYKKIGLAWLKQQAKTTWSRTDEYFRIIDNGNDVDDDSDLGIIIRTVYAEMRGGDDNAKAIVAESIVSRSSLPDGSYEKADGTVSGIVDRFYDVSNNSNASNDIFEKQASKNSAAAASKAYYGNSNIGKGVIFYNSVSSTIYDKNTKMQKINLPFTIRG